jgi:predicted dehydrogenase
LHQPVKIVLVGCGAVSQLYYSPALKELEKLQILSVNALFDPNPANIRLIQKVFPGAKALVSLDDISSKDFDFGIVASPPQYHAVQAIQLLQAGLSVLCEKPMAASVAEAEEMITVAERSSGLLAIGLFRRFFPATQTIRKILSSNMLGDIKSFSFSEGGYFQWPVQSQSYFKKATAHGVLADIGVHLLDLMIWWFGNPAEVFYEDDTMGGIEVNCRLQCKFDQNFSGEVRLSRDCMLPNSYLIHGKNGWLKWDVNDAPNQIQLGFNDSSLAIDARIYDVDPRNPLFPGEVSYSFEQSFTSQIYNLIAAKEGKESLMMPAKEAIKSLRVIESCYQNRTLMRMPWLSELEIKRAYQLNSQI